MATYAIFNYQFDKIIEHARQGEFEGMESEVIISSDFSFLNMATPISVKA